MKRTLPLLTALLVAAFAALPQAQIKKFTLDEMVQTADDAVYGQIVGSRVFSVDSPVDGPSLYFTVLTIEGRAMSDGRPLTIDVTTPGGFIDATRGVFNSEAPAADDIKVG